VQVRQKVAENELQEAFLAADADGSGELDMQVCCLDTNSARPCIDALMMY
jgi:hypothetical protein